ncbi:CdaR family transcriptional regulator [Prauserella marina]|uniref:Purine catabolism regulatory protein n=1 Tax=Prauserella marina TaxID=530584 RepID=A0A222VMN5_9PSEU|nr:PucR family transcriptional regulator ligand-binding domain-containing protein [Prauserella marina]ASR35175.1 CdaR family transcriptional regulator [Prauserella marina]PWV85061.1 purine catabolism regulator [Prauserella marina]SDC05714.1 purine catabolism regulatory protein [Prauserella marina]
MYPTVADVLALPVVRGGGPRVVAGWDALGHRVRWVHVAEVADIAHLLKGGELVLTTGVALPDDETALTRYVEELAGVGVAGLVVELVRHWNDELPKALVRAAQDAGMPLVTLSRETRYVAVSEAVNGLIVDAQVDELRAAEQVHETFTELTVAGAEPAVILREVARLTGQPVVLETLSHEVLAYDAAGTDAGELLAGWQQRSPSVRAEERTGYAPEAGWLVTIVGARGHDWGRLVLTCAETPPHRYLVVAERAASTLAVHHLLTREGEGLERQAHRAVLAELLASPALPAELPARAAALHVPLAGRRLVGAAIRPRLTGLPRLPSSASTQPLLRELAETTALATRRARVTALVAGVDDTSVCVLLSLSPQASIDAVLLRLAKEVQQSRTPVPVVIAVGSPVTSACDAARSLTEATHVAAAAMRLDSEPACGYHRLRDVRLRGLLHLLATDDRVAAFASRELGPLKAKDTATGSRLMQALRYFCEHGGNKSAAAAAAHTSRTAYYQQLARIEQVLGVRLEDPESMLSLHVALLVHDLLAPSGDSDHPNE